MIENPEKIWAANLWKNYKITSAQYFELLAKQNGKCAICGNISKQKLHVDHCHFTNKVRGLLCGSCNRGIGLFKDDRYLLNKAIEYLS